MKFELLIKDNVEKYIEYLKRAMTEEPEMMTTDVVEEDEIRRRVEDSFYQNTKSVLAVDNDMVVGRIEYHFYGCMQDGYRMAYVDWVYVLKGYRHQGIARQLFEMFEKDCLENHIDQYYLIRAENKNAVRFYDRFENARTDAEKILRKEIG